MARWSWTKQGARNGLNRKCRRARAKMIRDMISRTRTVPMSFEDYTARLDLFTKNWMAERRLV